jgi:hypothetical protein
MNKYKYFLIVFVIINIRVIGQNLVPNYSFENYTLCPDASGQITRATPWQNPSVGPTMADPDYFNACSSSYFGIPGTAGAFQYPKSGNAYAGFFGFQYGLEVREYIRSLLLDTLENNKCYVITMYVNLLNRAIYATNNLAVNFSSNAFVQSNYYPVNLLPHVLKFGNPIITDTLNWVEIKGIYTAQGNERYINIGNFKNDVDTDTLNVNPYPDGTLNGSYYLLDDVSVIPIESISGGMSAFAGNDTSVVIGDSVFIGQEIMNLNCNWYDSAGTLISSNTSGIYVQPLNSTYYVVEQNLCGTVTFDTVNVTVQPVGISENNINNSINVYPNPSTGNISMAFIKSNHAELNLKVIDINGRTVFTKTFSSADTRSNFTLDAPNGIYMLFICNSQTNETIVKRIVIQK